jgi:putative salt-induced outer membrane protein
MHFPRSFTILVLLLAMPLAVAADTVVLKNGDRITGSFVSADGKSLAIKTPYYGQISVKWSDVTEVTMAGPIYVTTSAKKTVTGAVSKMKDALVVHTTSGDVDVPLAQIAFVRSAQEQAKYEKSLHPGIGRDWNGNVGLGFSLARGNSQTTNLTTSAHVKRKTLSDLITLYESSVYSTNTAANLVTANAILGGARYDRNANKLLFGFVSADYTHDELQGLDLRSIYGGGLGWHAIDNPHTTLDLLGGVNYTRETYNGTAVLSPGLSVQRNLAAVTTGEDLTYKFGKITSLDEHFYFYPDLSELSQYRFTLVSEANTRINGWLSWQVTLNDLYVSNPPIAGTKPNDVILSTGLAVSFSH